MQERSALLFDCEEIVLIIAVYLLCKTKTNDVVQHLVESEDLQMSWRWVGYGLMKGSFVVIMILLIRLLRFWCEIMRLDLFL